MSKYRWIMCHLPEHTQNWCLFNTTHTTSMHTFVQHHTYHPYIHHFNEHNTGICSTLQQTPYTHHFSVHTINITSTEVPQVSDQHHYTLYCTLHGIWSKSLRTGMHHTHTKPPLFSIHNIDNIVLCTTTQCCTVRSYHPVQPACTADKSCDVNTPVFSSPWRPSCFSSSTFWRRTASSSACSSLTVCVSDFSLQHTTQTLSLLHTHTHTHTHTHKYTLSRALSHRCTTNGLPCNCVSVSVHRSTAKKTSCIICASDFQSTHSSFTVSSVLNLQQSHCFTSTCLSSSLFPSSFVIFSLLHHTKTMSWKRLCF